MSDRFAGTHTSIRSILDIVDPETLMESTGGGANVDDDANGALSNQELGMADPERIGPAPWSDARMCSEGSKEFRMISKGATEMGLDRAPPAPGSVASDCERTGEFE